MTNIRVVGLVLVLGVAVASWILTCVAWQFDAVTAGVVPLDARSFSRLTVVTVGSGGAHENPSRGGPAIAIGLGERMLLVDAGRSVAEGLRAARIPPSQPDVVLLSSLLPENTVGLDDLLASGWLAGREKPLRVLGPTGTAELVDAIGRAQTAGLRAVADGLGLDPAGAKIVATEVADGFEETLEPFRVRAAALPGGPLPALAWNVVGGERSLVVGGTGWGHDALEALARDANLLVHEARHIPSAEEAAQLGIEADPDALRREAALHTGLDAVGGIASRAGVDTLVLVRLRPPPVFDLQISSRVGETFGGRIVVAADGDEIRP